ncbi:MAG: TetR/AcrR family transcriptional regulator [Gemmataceae bacterium]
MRTKTPLQADKILEAATRLFGAQRFHEVRMEDVAAEAEVGKGTLYRYFNDKEELYLALLVRASELFIQRIEDVASGQNSPRARLEKTVAAIIDEFDNQPHLLDLIQRAEVLHEAGVEFPWQKTRERLPKLIKELLAAGEKQGAFAVGDQDLAILLLLGGIRSVIRFGEKPRPPDIATRIVDHFLHGADPTRPAGKVVDEPTRRRSHVTV